METMNNAIRAGMEASIPPRKQSVVTAVDIMTRNLVTFRADENIRTAVDALLRRDEALGLVGEIEEIAEVARRHQQRRHLGGHSIDQIRAGRLWVERQFGRVAHRIEQLQAGHLGFVAASHLGRGDEILR